MGADRAHAQRQVESAVVTVETVPGPIPLERLGVTVTHEQVICEPAVLSGPLADLSRGCQ